LDLIPRKADTVSKTDKDRLRAEALSRRDALPLSDRATFSQAIAQQVPDFITALGAGPIGGFWPIRSEIDPRPAMALLTYRGLKTALPVVTDEGLVFRLWQEGDALASGSFGLKEPFETADAVNPTGLLVPLAAFDRRGHRIGYGAGYYDRAIARLTASGSVLTIGVAFSVQEIDRVPDEPHDRALDVIITENETIRIS
jgi:5-formyltetrahydrofolate cyclo-ligase